MLSNRWRSSVSDQAFTQQTESARRRRGSCNRRVSGGAGAAGAQVYTGPRKIFPARPNLASNSLRTCKCDLCALPLRKEIGFREIASCIVLRDCSSRSDRHVFLETIVAHDFSFVVGFSNAGVDCRSRGIEKQTRGRVQGRDENCISGRSQSLAGTGSAL